MDFVSINESALQKQNNILLFQWILLFITFLLSHQHFLFFIATTTVLQFPNDCYAQYLCPSYKEVERRLRHLEDTSYCFVNYKAILQVHTTIVIKSCPSMRCTHHEQPMHPAVPIKAHKSSLIWLLHVEDLTALPQAFYVQ